MALVNRTVYIQVPTVIETVVTYDNSNGNIFSVSLNDPVIYGAVVNTSNAFIWDSDANVWRTWAQFSNTYPKQAQEIQAHVRASFEDEIPGGI